MRLSMCAVLVAVCTLCLTASARANSIDSGAGQVFAAGAAASGLDFSVPDSEAAYSLETYSALAAPPASDNIASAPASLETAGPPEGVGHLTLVTVDCHNMPEPSYFLPLAGLLFGLGIRRRRTV